MKAARLALGFYAVTLALGGCSDDYSLPPTACDDYCNAVQRGGCSDDDPADCVRNCENGRQGRARTLCPDAWAARNDCLLRADRDSFVCRDDKSRLPDTCLAERRAISECVTPGSGTCFDECVRQAQSCGGDLPDCESSCRRTSVACQPVSAAFYGCIAGYPVECRDPFAEDTRPLDQIPCLAEVGALLSCGG